MKRTIVALLAVFAFATLTTPAMANECTIDQVPAATLLLPYFQVDLDDPGGVDTLFSINNASDAPQVVHLVFWTDESVPTIDFDIFLTGYDVQTFNLRDIFNGNLPVTAVADVDPGDSISPNYDHPAQYGTWDSQSGQFPGCSYLQPLTNPALSAAYIALMRQAHTGQPVDFFNGNCAAQDFGDNIARGYITADVVFDCNLLFPGDAGYSTIFIMGEAANAIWGDYLYVDPRNDFAQGEDLVSIEAMQGGLAFPGQFTFYGRYNYWTGADAREPLPTTFATRYLKASGPFEGTQLVVWRDSLDSYLANANGWVCGTSGAEWYPLAQDQVVAFDEEENAVELCNERATSRISPPPPYQQQFCFPAETQLVDLQSGNGIADPINPPYDFGWLFLNLNQGVYGGTAYYMSQAWVTTIMQADGRFSVGMNAIQLDSACDYNGDALSFGNPPLGIDPSQKISLP